MILFANGLVSSLFLRSPRLLATPANLLLLCLSVADLAPGLALIPAAVATMGHRGGGHGWGQLVSCHLPVGAVVACETASTLFVVAVALDKVWLMSSNYLAVAEAAGDNIILLLQLLFCCCCCCCNNWGPRHIS